ncbi:MAG TPA: oligosaccharide flippase family protein [Blastocatellia bacterium]|nr:oligosaccharide flippase family protein [Blastocatellia bacterium]
MPKKITEKTMKGVVALTATQGAVLALTLGTNIVLARLLEPGDVGIYALLNIVVLAAYFFTDFGLAGTLIQRPEEPCRRELRTVFTVQMVLALALTCGLVMLGPTVRHFYRLDEGIGPALPVLSLILLATPFESVSGVVLERRLNYSAVGVIHLLGGISYAGTSISLAVTGAGVWSLIGGNVASSLTRALVAVTLSRWPIGVALEGRFLRESLSSGISYQLGGILPLVRDNAPLLMAGVLFGPIPVGYVAWARTLTYGLTNVFAHAWARVGYSATARLCQERQQQSVLIEKMTLTLTLVILPLSILLIGLRRPMISVIFGDKWLPALPAVVLFGMRMIGASLATLFVAALNGNGHFPLGARILSIWTLLEVLVSTPLILMFGGIGVAIGAAATVWVAVVWMIRALQKISCPGIVKAVTKPTVAALITSLFLEVMSSYVTGVISLAVIGLSGLAVYLVVIVLTIPEISASAVRHAAGLRQRFVVGEL